MESQHVQIQKDMTISEILQLVPSKAGRMAEIMTAAGLHCVGCGASTFETLEEGLLGHGFSEEQLQEVLGQLNDALESDDESDDHNHGHEGHGHDHEGHDHGAHGDHDDEIIPVQFTKAALNKAKELMKQDHKEGWGLRVGVIPGGCSGYSYELAFQENPEDDDKILTQEGVNLFVDQESYKMLSGVTVDFLHTLKESGFKFSNPNAKSGCGCGKSFN